MSKRGTMMNMTARYLSFFRHSGNGLMRMSENKIESREDLCPKSVVS